MKNHEKGQVVVFAMLIMLVLMVLGASTVYITTHEAKNIKKSKDEVRSFYIANSGVEKAIWDLGQDSTYSGETEIPIGDGVFTVSVSTTAIDAQYQIISNGYTPDAVSPKNITNIDVICKKPSDLFDPVSAFASNSDINLQGNVRIDGRPDIYGITVPAGATVTIGSAAVKVYGTPDAQGTADAFTFEDVFDVSMEELRSMATTIYTDPPNNAPATGMTYIDFIVDSKFIAADNNWDGSGILIVDGDLKLTGGNYEGIIYVTGNFEAAGNVTITGALYVEGTASLTSGTPRIIYSAEAIETAQEACTYVKVLSWVEF